VRRRTPGVLKVEELVAERLARADTMDPENLIRVLEPLVLERRRARLLDVIGKRLSSVSVLFDSPYDPHNGAAALRSCDAFGIQTLHILERSRTPFLAAASVARGANKWVDIVVHTDAASALQGARGGDANRVLVAAHPKGELAPEDLATKGPLTIVLGNERDGIRDDIDVACTHRVRVPMRGFVESLNVSVTLAILLHASTRGRMGDLDPVAARRLYARGLYFSVAQADLILENAGSTSATNGGGHTPLA
jgi:tRNA (guanosine-2'-O-)-methyltransferase